MKVEMELWHLILLLVFWFGAVGLFSKWLLSAWRNDLNARFAGIDISRKEGAAQLRMMIQSHLEQERKTEQQLLDLERDILIMKGELPLHYVRREDYIRGQSILEAKMDALYNKIEMLQFKGICNG